MSDDTAELEQLRAGVNCAALLERLPPPWKLDAAESSRDCLKYRRGKGEIIIVNHGGRGWWDAGGTAKGDVFSLVQHLQPELNFGHARRLLREYLGLAPGYPRYEQPHCGADPKPAVERWAMYRRLEPRSPAWRYLAGERRLPAAVLRAAAAADAIRAGAYGTACFAHRDARGEVAGFEMRGPAFRSFAKGGDKSLFRLPGWIRGCRTPPSRLVVAEAPIDALSVAALERLAGNTLYAATSGGMGQGTVEALASHLAAIAGLTGAVLVAATDNDLAGARYADQLREQARAAGVGFQRLAPPDGVNDWNDVLRGRASR